jgi:uncharacterized phage protein (TIGR01671 family)
MREIKIRAWNIKHNVMLDKIDIFDILSKDPSRIMTEKFYEENIIQQYTGILDDNNKEIYEGDIIEHGCTTQHYESVIAYNAPSFIAKTFYHKVDHGRSEPNWHIAWDRKGIEAFKDGWYMQNRQFTGENYLRVIGNIYENPELLG